MEKYSAELKISETEEIIELPYQYFSKFSKLT